MHRIRRASDGCHCRSASTTMAMRLKASVTLSKLAEATPSTRDLPQMHRPEESTLPLASACQALALPGPSDVPATVLLEGQAD